MGDQAYEKEREQRLTHRRREGQVQKAKSTVRRVAVWAIVFAAVAAGVWGLTIAIRQSEDDRPGEAVPYQGRNHIQPGQPHDSYFSTPPTSGPHYATTVAWGVYAQEIPDELQVHNLEHGGVFINYKPGAISEGDVAALGVIARDMRKVAVAPYSKDFGGVVALTAWQRIQILQDVDEEAIRLFIEKNSNHSPENIPN